MVGTLSRQERSLTLMPQRRFIRRAFIGLLAASFFFGGLAPIESSALSAKRACIKERCKPGRKSCIEAFAEHHRAAKALCVNSGISEKAIRACKKAERRAFKENRRACKAVYKKVCRPCCKEEVTTSCDEQFLQIAAVPTVERFAPVLRFDQVHRGLPMSADVYFNAVMTPTTNEANGTITWSTPWDGPPAGQYWDSTSEMYWPVDAVCGRDECNNGMSNNDFQTLRDGKVPTYFSVISDKEGLDLGRLRIAYWWFYGFQYPCNDGAGAVGDDGAHHGDWEHIVVTTSPDRSQIEAVTYFFHGDWYTRQAGGFETVGDRPVVYVGKTAHGNYHSRDHSGWMVGTPSHCCEYADYRNPDSESVWDNVQDNLVNFSLSSESWMLADKIGSTYEYEGQGYSIDQWRWGPHISHCEFRLFGCWDWDHVSAIGTHPTGEVLDWTFPSCDEQGCSGYTFVCAYSAKYNQGWPYDYGQAPAQVGIEDASAARTPPLEDHEAGCRRR